MKRKIPALLAANLVVMLALAVYSCKEDESPVPVIESVNPTSGYAGTSVTINGLHFDETTVVRFNNVEAPVTTFTANQIVVEVPNGASTGPITVTTSGVTATGPEFIFKTEPIITIKEASVIAPFDASLNAEITSTGTEPIIDHGFIYSTTAIQSVNDGTKVSLGAISQTGQITTAIENLTKQTQYFVRAFIVTADKTVLTSQNSFTTANTNQWIKAGGAFSGTFDAAFPLDFQPLPYYTSIGNKGYLPILAGTNNGKTVVPIFEYNPISHILTRMPDLPAVHRAFHTSFVVGEKIFVGLGHEVFGGGSQYLNDFWVFNTSTKQWSQLNNFPGPAMALAVSIILDGKAFTGFGVKHIGSDATFWQYNPMTDSWTQKSSPITRQDRVLMSVAVNEKGYFVFYTGGQLEVFEYSPLTDNWTKKKNLPFTPQGLGSGSVWPFRSLSVAGKGYMIDEKGSIWQYNPSLDEWTSIEAPPNKSTFRFSVAIENKIYVGSDTDVYMYVPE